MKTLHVPFHFYPEPVGGTEVYALSLVQRLRRMGDQAEIAAPGRRQESYVHEDIQVHRFAVSEVEDVSALYGAGDEPAAEQFEQILRESGPDLVHLHGVSPAISLRLLRRTKRRGIPVILTVHIPGILCTRGTLLEHGKNVCDGKLNVSRCSQCALEAKRLPGYLARIAGKMPAAVGGLVAAIGPQAGWATALRMTRLQSLRQGVLRQFLAEVDHIVAVSEWLRQALLRNGVPEQNVTLCRHGATQTGLHAVPLYQPKLRSVKQIAYIGRLNEAKGAHVLIDALLRSPEIPVRLDIYGIVQEGSAERYDQRLRAKAKNDDRIRFLGPLPNHEVPDRLRDYDALAIPSVGLETGPLTVYDAFAAGIPVIGSRRGGIGELVADEIDGLLVEPGDVSAWARVLSRICYEGGLLERLRSGVAPPRTMEAVAVEMIGLYERLRANKAALRPGNKTASNAVCG
jgi:glycosyltransferase involved in cell wall biosynthesis